MTDLNNRKNTVLISQVVCLFTLVTATLFFTNVANQNIAGHQTASAITHSN